MRNELDKRSYSKGRACVTRWPKPGNWRPW